LLRHVSRAVVPPGDVLLHAGDFSMTGNLEPVRKFNEWLGKLPHTTKIVIAGKSIEY
jgi:predicted phosphohydrolase